MRPSHPYGAANLLARIISVVRVELRLLVIHDFPATQCSGMCESIPNLYPNVVGIFMLMCGVTKPMRVGGDGLANRAPPYKMYVA